MLLRTLALVALAGCASPDTEVAPARAADSIGPAVSGEGTAADTVDADLSAIPPDLRRCVAATVRDPGRRFEVVGEVEREGDRFVLVEAFLPDGADGALTSDLRLLRVTDVPAESERCRNVLVIGSEAPGLQIRDSVGEAYDELIRQAAASEVERVGGPRAFESVYRQAGRDDLRECGAGDAGLDGCFESAWAAGYRAAGVAVEAAGTSRMATGALQGCVPEWARANGATAEVTARADGPDGEFVLLESVRSGRDPIDAAVSFRPVLLRLRNGACESLLPDRTDDVDLRAYASVDVVRELLRESAAWNADRAGGAGAYADLLAEGYGGALVECAERGGEAGFCVDPDRAEALRAIGVSVVRPDR